MKPLGLLALLVFLLPGLGWGVTIGGFEQTRGGENGLDSGARRAAIEGGVADVVIVTTDILTPKFLVPVDVLILDAVGAINTPVVSLSGEEQSALVAWVEAGGGLLVSSDNGDFQVAANSMLGPFGVTASGTSVGGLWESSDFDRGVFFPLLDAPFGVVNELGGSFIGSFSNLGGFQVVSRWSAALVGQPSIVARDFVGLGRVVAVGDHQLTTPGHLDAESFLLNAIAWLDQSDTTVSQNGTPFRLFGTSAASSVSNPNTLIRFSPSTGAQTIVGQVGQAQNVRDIDWNPSTETLFGSDVFDNLGVIQEIDVSTGISSPFATILDDGMPVAVGPIAFRSDGTLFAAVGNNSFDGRSIGVVDLVNQTYAPEFAVPKESRVASMDITPGGTLLAVYATGFPSIQTLVTFDLDPITLVSEKTIGNANVSDMDYAPDGNIYHSNSSFALFRIDPDTGAQTNVGFGEFAAFGGIASRALPDLIFANGLEP